MTKTLSALFIALVLLGPSLVAQKNSQIDWWRGSWKEALSHARERNVPLIIAVIQDEEEASQRIVDDLFKDKKIVAAFNEAIPIICSRENHGTIKIDKGVGQIEVCKRYGGTTCDRHIDHEVEMFSHFFSDDAVKTPQVMFCRPDLGLMDRIVDVEAVDAYLKTLTKARKDMGPGLSEQLLKDSREMITRGRNHLRSKDYRQAWDAVAELVALGGPADAVARAAKIHKSVDEALEKELEAAYKRAEEGEALTALLGLDALMDDFDGTPPAQKAKTAFDRIKKTKAGKLAARDLSREKKLRPDLDKAAELETKGEWAKARDIYQRLVTRGEGLPCALRAQARLDYFANDPDIKKLLEQSDAQN